MFYCLKQFNILIYDYGNQYIATIIVSVCFLIEGMHYGWSSSAIPKLLEKVENITQDEAKYIIQMFTYGSVTCNILSFADYPRLNERFGIIASVVAMLLSWILMICSNSATSFMVARFFAGAGRGLLYQIAMNYICEIADPKIRGLLGCSIFVLANLGVFLIYLLGQYLEVIHCAIFGATISIVELIAVKWLPESPYMLLLRGKTSTAKKVLRSLRKLLNVEDELEKITNIVKIQDEENTNFFSIFILPTNRKTFYIILILNTFQGFAGINISIRHILKLSGGNLESYQIAIVTYLISVISCAISASFIDHIGRRIILQISFFGSGLSLFILGVYTYIYYASHYHITVSNVIPLGCLLSYTVIYRMGIGIIPSLLSSEMFPMHVKNCASCVTGILSIMINFITINFIDLIQDYCGLHVVYWVCSFNCFAGLLYTYFFIPETSRKSLIDVNNSFTPVSTFISNDAIK